MNDEKNVNEMPAGLKVEMYSRIPFDVQAIKITAANINDIAIWCGGHVKDVAYKVAGSKTMLPCLKMPGNGPLKGKLVTAMLNSWVVYFQGEFRFYRENSFNQAFLQKTEGGFELREYVMVTNRAADQFGRVGQVVGVEPDLLEIDFESYNDNGTKFHPSEVKKYDPTQAL
jgi:hypothetical protein